MDSAKAIPAIWVYTTGSAFNAPAQGYGDWLTPQQICRLERIRQARLLSDGKHRAYYLDEGRSQYDVKWVRVGTQTRQFYLTYNVLGLISTKGTDLLFGEEPEVTVDVPEQQDAITDIGERCSMHVLFYNCAVDASAEGEAYIEALVQDGQVYLQQVPADEIFPVGALGPDLQYQAYDRIVLANIGDMQNPCWLMLKTTYTAGSIDRQCFQILEDKKTLKAVSLDSWPTTDGAPLQPTTKTGIDRPTIVFVPNLLKRGQPVSDYDGAIDLQDTLNAKVAQLAYVILKHSDPRMCFPEEAFDENGNIRSDFEAFAYSDPEKLPKYITWDGQLAAAVEDRKFALTNLLVVTETSPVLLGLEEGAAPEAFKSYRLKAQNSLSKAQRKAMYWKAVIRLALDVAQDLENTIPGTRYDRTEEPIGVVLNDGIPVDELDEATRLSTLRAAGLLSVEGGLEQLYKDPAIVAKELDRLEKERAQMTPSVFGGDGGGTREAGEGMDVSGGGREDSTGAGRYEDAPNPDSAAGASNSYTNSGVSAGSAAGRAA